MTEAFRTWNDPKYQELELLIDSVSDLVFWLDLEGTILNVNQEVLRRLGYGLEELLGKKVFCIHVQEQQEEARSFLADVIAGKRNTLLQTFMTKDGREIPFDIRTAIGNWKGRRVLFGICRDVSEQRKREMQLWAQRNLVFSLAAVRSLNEALPICLETAISISEMDCGGIYVKDNETGNFVLKHAKGLSSRFLDEVKCLKSGTERWHMVMSGKAIYAPFESIDSLVQESVLCDEHLKTVIINPVSHKGEIIALLSMASHTMELVPEVNKVCIETISSQIGNFIARLRAEEALRESEKRYRRFNVILEERIRERTEELSLKNGN